MPREMFTEIDLRMAAARLATNRTSRRRFIGGSAAAAAAWLLGPSFLAACGSKGGSGGGGGGERSSFRLTANLELAAVHGPRFRQGVPRRRRASPWTTKRTSTTTRSGSPRSRSRCSASRTSAPTLPCPTHVHGHALAATRLPQRVQQGQHPEHRRTCGPTSSKPASTPGRKYTAPYMSGFVGLGVQPGSNR